MKDITIDPAPAPNAPLHVVTGAFGFSGKYIALRLLERGIRVRTLTNHPDGDSPLRTRIEVAPLNFRNVEELVRSLQGATTVYNTYWVRFARGRMNHETAVQNTKMLIRAAAQAGVQRIVHVSITNPSPSSPLPYFRGKAAVEEAIRSSALSYAILRPAVVFGAEDILLNNIAWMLRRFPVFALPGKGDYGLQPIFVEDLAALAVDSGRSRENIVVDAVGPEAYSYADLVQLIRNAIGSRSRVLHIPAAGVVLASWLLGRLVNDVVLTKDEVSGLMANLLISKEPPTGSTSLRAWLQAHARTTGRNYASELERHYRS